jgi:C-terminal processing protease CtpA/Prc
LPKRSHRHPRTRVCAALWVIVLGCGSPSWQGGIHANFAWSPRGVRVVEVPAGSPAEAAGLREGDRVVAIDGKPVANRSSEEVHAALTGEVGTHVVLSVLRDEKPLELRIERVPYNEPRNRGVLR